MAQFHHLNVYKKSFDLLVKLTEAITSFRRQHRYTLGERLNNSVVNFILLIYKANSAESINRANHIQQLLDEYQKISLLVRLSCELRNISREKYMELAVILEDIERQLNGWKRQTVESIK